MGWCNNPDSPYHLMMTIDRAEIADRHLVGAYLHTWRTQLLDLSEHAVYLGLSAPRRCGRHGNSCTAAVGGLPCLLHSFQSDPPIIYPCRSCWDSRRALLVLTPSAALDPVGVLAGLSGAGSMACGIVLNRKWQPPVSLLTFTAWQLTAVTSFCFQ